VIMVPDEIIIKRGARKNMIKVSAYQGKCFSEIDENFRKVREIIGKAGENGCDFLCFPEAYLSNYSPELAIPLKDQRILELSKAAERFDMVVVVGLSEKEKKKIFNTAVILYRGKIIGKYRKTILTDDDKKVYSQGSSLPVFKAKGICFGVIICHDSSFIEPALTMRLKGARLLFSPHNNSISCDQMDEHRVLVRNNHVGLAALLQMVVVRSNVIAVEDQFLGYGDSAIFSTDGTVTAAAPLFAETLISAEFKESIFREEKWRRLDDHPKRIHQLLSDVIGKSSRQKRASVAQS